MATLAPGLLLAGPRLGDPNFERTVIVLGHHDETGALGWVLNGKPIVPVSQLLRDAEIVPPEIVLPSSPPFGALVRVGGPVMPGSAWMLFERDPGQSRSHAEHELGEHFAATGAREAIEAVARGTGPRFFRFFLGYAGWGPGQLEQEIGQGAWLPAELDESILRSTDNDSLWDAAYRRSVGASPMAFTSGTRGSA